MKKQVSILFLLIIFMISVVSAVGCGDTITEDTVLTEDLLNCSGNGIIIGADNITLDCNGHRIDGNGDFNGISVSNNVNGVTIKNCNIQEFGYGIYLGSN